MKRLIAHTAAVASVLALAVAFPASASIVDRDGDRMDDGWEQSNGLRVGMPFAPQKNGHLALHVDDVAAARAELEAKGVEFTGEILDTGVCHMTLFTDPEGNDLMLHHRYAPAP